MFPYAEESMSSKSISKNFKEIAEKQKMAEFKYSKFTVCKICTKTVKTLGGERLERERFGHTRLVCINTEKDY